MFRCFLVHTMVECMSVHELLMKINKIFLSCIFLGTSSLKRSFEIQFDDPPKHVKH